MIYKAFWAYLPVCHLFLYIFLKIFIIYKIKYAKRWQIDKSSNPRKIVENRGKPMDFLKVDQKVEKGNLIIYPDFKVIQSKDVMIRGKSFYAIWDADTGLWSTDPFRVPVIIDDELRRYASDNDYNLKNVVLKDMSTYATGSWDRFLKYCSSMPDNAKDLDTKLTFLNTIVQQKDYISKRLPYALEDGPTDCYDKLMSTLYDKDERQKIEWSIGSIISGDSRKIQKFLVLYGEAGTGKSTVLNIIQKLFEGYYTTFDAKSLASPNNQFSTEVFKHNPLVAIQHDGDLSRIEDNSKLNSIISHEEITINEKHKSLYTMKLGCFLYMGSNKPVKITDSKSGILRRLIDVRPTGKKLPINEYNKLMKGVEYELGAIAKHCLDVYNEMGKSYYNNYRPRNMQEETDVFYNFVEDSFEEFRDSDYISGQRAFEMYKMYCDNGGYQYKSNYMNFRSQLRDYFEEYYERKLIDGVQVRHCYIGFKTSKFTKPILEPVDKKNLLYSIKMSCTKSLLDKELADCQAQEANSQEMPCKKWEEVTTCLKDIDTSKVHYIRPPKNLIVIDFDLKDENGNKSPEKNLAAASEWPSTYAEFSKSGGGIHLHYYYTGDVTKVSRLYSDGIEIKVFNGKASLRRKLSKCNNVPIATLSSGLPMKEEKVVNFDGVKDEKALRALIKKNLRKEIHPATKPSIDFINKILDDYYASGKTYSVVDLRPSVMAFAANSSHQADYCLKIVANMKFQSEDISSIPEFDKDTIIFFDVEVFPNLFLLNWKYQGKDKKVVRMINPTPEEIENLLHFKLVGFNNRRYDNHILYARYLGFTNQELYDLSQRIVNGSKNAMFGEAYNLSYTDIYDFCAKKQSLKKWEIELNIHHQELGLPWDQPVDESLWEKVAEYCDNDVIATEAVWDHCQADFTARKILADLAGKTVNDSTNSLTTAIIFGKDRNPELVYTDLATGEATIKEYERHDILNSFPGYEFVKGDDNRWHNMYRDTDLGLGGYVYAEPGMYTNVALLDIASLHPHSILAMNCFGEYTKNFKDLVDTRILIKHNDYISAKKLFGGRLAKYLDDPEQAKDLAQALKIAINSVYGLTSATFDNPFKDNRNKNNIVALRGALFMRELQYEVQKRGYRVAHIKTDSIKIPDADEAIISFCMDFAKKYGYTFEHEATYSKMCLVNNAVYIAKYKDGKHAGEWTATGAQFQHPYVFKYLFSKEPIIFEDMCEAKTVQTALYLDMNEELGENEHSYHFIGKAGQFCPIISGKGGGELLREKDGKYYSAAGAKGYRWLESELVKELGKEQDIDIKYFKSLVDDAVENISNYGDIEWLTDETDDTPPWE